MLIFLFKLIINEFSEDMIDMQEQIHSTNF